jgi:hypothetical protein
MSRPSASARAANETRGELILVLDGVDYVLRPSNEAIRAFEVKLDKACMVLVQEAMRGLTTHEIAVIATECIRAWGRETGDKQIAAVNPERISDLIMDAPGGIVEAASLIRDLLINATTGGYTSKGEVKAGTATT